MPASHVLNIDLCHFQPPEFIGCLEHGGSYYGKVNSLRLTTLFRLTFPLWEGSSLYGNRP